MSHNHNNTQPGSAGIVAHYRAKGLRKDALREAVERHVRLLRPLDPDAAEHLECAVLADDAHERYRREVNSARQAARRRQKNGSSVAHQRFREQANKYRKKGK